MKQTPLLAAVLSLFDQAKKPLSVPKIQVRLKEQNLEPNKTTLYRMLEKLVQEKVVQELLLDPKVTYYEKISHHHHHFKCDSCDTIECVEDPELETHIHALEEKLNAQGLRVSEHHFSLNGTCSNCK